MHHLRREAMMIQKCVITMANLDTIIKSRLTWLEYLHGEEIEAMSAKDKARVLKHAAALANALEPTINRHLGGGGKRPSTKYVAGLPEVTP
jgi:hypothetical protein